MKRGFWPYPDLRNTVTVHHITDSHIGYRDALTADWHDNIAQDSERLKIAGHVGHIHTGDFVETWSGNTNDARFKAFRDTIKGDGLPWADVPGNHDLGDYAAVTSRTPDAWAAAVGGRAKARSVTLMGGIAVIGLPNPWTYTTQFVNNPVTADDLTWLDQQLTALGGTMAWVCFHEPPAGTVPSSEGIEPLASIDAVLGAHSNVIGILSGHWHRQVENPDQVQVQDRGGKRIYVVTGPSALGIRGDYGWPEQAANAAATSLWVSYGGDFIDVRWRHHLGRRWTDSAGTFVRRQLKAA